MNTHSDGLYEYAQDFGLKLESATPAVDQPVDEVDGG